MPACSFLGRDSQSERANYRLCCCELIILEPTSQEKATPAIHRGFRRSTNCVNRYHFGNRSTRVITAIEKQLGVEGGGAARRSTISHLELEGAMHCIIIGTPSFFPRD